MYSWRRDQTVKKFSSILPANSRLTTVDLSASPSRRPGSYNPFTGKIVQGKQSIKMAPIKGVAPTQLDKVSISKEAKDAEVQKIGVTDINNEEKTSSVLSKHIKYKGYV